MAIMHVVAETEHKNENQSNEDDDDNDSNNDDDGDDEHGKQIYQISYMWCA